MAIPDYQSCMLPVLQCAAAKAPQSLTSREMLAAVSAEFRLTDEELREMLPSGATTTFGSRVSWACTYLKKAGLLIAPRRGLIAITDRGIKVLASRPTRVDTALLKQFPEFVAFVSRTESAQMEPAATQAEEDDTKSRTPHEILESSYGLLRSELAAEVLQRVKECTPAFFERLVVELLVKMGYGGSRSDAGRALGKSGDGGIDGIIKEDRLGLDAIYIQAKRWTEKSVGSPEVQQFQGALAGQGASKGIFITTSKFTRDASTYADGLKNSKIVLIDGEQLALLMIDFGVGVNTTAAYEVKRIDSEYFEETES